MKRHLIVLLTLSILLTSCKGNSSSLEQYSFNQNKASEIDEPIYEEFGALKALGADMALIGDESVYSDESITSASAFIADVNNKQTIFSKNANQRIYPASVTKIMTAYLAFKYCNLDDVVTITDASIITEEGSKLCNINPGDQLTVRQLLNGLLINSGNDCAVALAVHISGSVEAFAELMNSEAYAIGAVNSHFVNPHGLHNDEHYTTAYDLYLIFTKLIEYEEAKTIVNTQSYTTTYKLSDGTERTATWNTTNKYLTGEYTIPENVNVWGGKTGFTDQAGYNLILLSYDVNGNPYIAVVIQNPDYYSLYTNMSSLLRKISNN